MHLKYVILLLEFQFLYNTAHNRMKENGLRRCECLLERVVSEKALLTRNSAIADKPRDAFRGHSRSPNMVPFHMLGMVSY